MSGETDALNRFRDVLEAYDSKYLHDPQDHNIAGTWLSGFLKPGPEIDAADQMIRLIIGGFQARALETWRGERRQFAKERAAAVKRLKASLTPQVRAAVADAIEDLARALYLQHHIEGDTFAYAGTLKKTLTEVFGPYSPDAKPPCS